MDGKKSVKLKRLRKSIGFPAKIHQGFWASKKLWIFWHKNNFSRPSSKVLEGSFDMILKTAQQNFGVSNFKVNSLDNFFTSFPFSAHSALWELLHDTTWELVKSLHPSGCMLVTLRHVDWRGGLVFSMGKEQNGLLLGLWRFMKYYRSLI